MDSINARKLAKRYIRSEPMPMGLRTAFLENGWDDALSEVYELTAQYILENEGAPKGVMTHLKQILPSIAFYKVLIQREGSKERALEVFGEYCFVRIEKLAKIFPAALKIPGLYKLVPGLMEKLLDSTFGEKNGFQYVRRECRNGFAADMLMCPYVAACKKYGCPELAQFFCKSDDLCYGNLHPKLVWARTKTLGMGGDCCDFKLYIKGE